VPVLTRSPSAHSGRAAPGRRFAGRFDRRGAKAGLHFRQETHGGRPKRAPPRAARRATEILVYKVYRDRVEGLDLGGSSAQSVILMLIVIGPTVLQFRYIERRV
jgi:hypothetical protein